MNTFFIFKNTSFVLLIIFSFVKTTIPMYKQGCIIIHQLETIIYDLDLRKYLTLKSTQEEQHSDLLTYLNRPIDPFIIIILTSVQANMSINRKHFVVLIYYTVL